MEGRERRVCCTVVCCDVRSALLSGHHTVATGALGSTPPAIRSLTWALQAHSSTIPGLRWDGPVQRASQEMLRHHEMAEVCLQSETNRNPSSVVEVGG